MSEGANSYVAGGGVEVGGGSAQDADQGLCARPPGGAPWGVWDGCGHPQCCARVRQRLARGSVLLACLTVLRQGGQAMLSSKHMPNRQPTSQGSRLQASQYPSLFKHGHRGRGQRVSAAPPLTHGAGVGVESVHATPRATCAAPHTGR